MPEPTTPRTIQHLMPLEPLDGEEIQTGETRTETYSTTQTPAPAPLPQEQSKGTLWFIILLCVAMCFVLSTTTQARKKCLRWFQGNSTATSAWWRWLHGLALVFFVLSLFASFGIAVWLLYLTESILLALGALLGSLFVDFTVTSCYMVFLLMLKDISNTNALTSKIASDLEEIKKHMTSNNEQI